MSLGIHTLVPEIGWRCGAFVQGRLVPVGMYSTGPLSHAHGSCLILSPHITATLCPLGTTHSK
eukprot:141035-Chlamydomonas_euryale.AAC.11